MLYESVSFKGIPWQRVERVYQELKSVVLMTEESGAKVDNDVAILKDGLKPRTYVKTFHVWTGTLAMYSLAEVSFGGH